jgi:hypothetical protein
MSLLDRVMSANGQSNAAYLRGGRHVIRVHRLELNEPNPAQGIMKPSFKCDGELLFSDRASFASEQSTEGDDGKPANKKGMIVRANDPFKYPDSALARVRRFLVAAKAAATGKEVNEATMGLEAGADESESAFASRVSAEVKRLLGPDQPLKGAVLTIVGTEGKNQKTGTPYTLFEPCIPTREDLIAAGLLKG